jgi:hypothetical protein
MRSEVSRMALIALSLALPACGDNLSHSPTGGDAVGDALSCIPNLDGRIEASELRVAYGTAVAYDVSPAGGKRTVDLVGQEASNGGTLWDFSADYAVDRTAMLTANALSSQWFASSFPGGQFVSPIDVDGALEGVYRADDAGIYLLGVASAKEAPPQGQTLLVYTTPITIDKLPLVVGASWVSKGQVVMGTLQGQPYSGQDVYEVSDDALGSVALHDFIFEGVHRVRTKVTISPSAGASTSQWQVGFVFECFGEVVRATSLPGEQNANFTTAAEVRRLGN